MALKWMKPLTTIWSQINARRAKPFLVFAGTGALVIAGWLFWPSAYQPYVRVAGPMVAVSIHCMPDNVQLQTLTPYATLTNARIALYDLATRRVFAQYPLPTASVRKNSGILFTTSTSSETRKAFTDALSRFKGKGGIEIYFEFTRLPALDLQSLKIKYNALAGETGCSEEELTGAELRERSLGITTKLMHYSPVQERLSDILLMGNETLGNIILAAMIVGFFWLLLSFTNALRQVYLVSDAALRSSLERGLSPDHPQRNALLNERTKESYVAVRRRLSFARVVGPAVGFLLTVSSLIAGLHPSASAAKDTFLFVSSLQLALVATFMGLLIRIVAEFALRFHYEAAERKLKLIAH